MKSAWSLIAGQSGASKLALALAVAVVGYLALAGSWAATMVELLARFEAQLPL